MPQWVISQIFLLSSTSFHHCVGQRNATVGQWWEDGWLYLINKGGGSKRKGHNGHNDELVSLYQTSMNITSLNRHSAQIYSDTRSG